MSQVHQCDRCHNIIDGFIHTLSGNVLGGELKIGWHPKELELCELCAKEIIVELKKWWKHESKTE